MAITSSGTPERPKLSERARDAVRERIVSGEFAFGRVLREADLSLMFHMSKSPIREALVQLEREGLVEMSPNRSTRVFTMTPRNVSELTELRLLLEDQAIGLATERNGKALADELAALVDAGEEAAAGNDAGLFVRADHSFHAAVFRYCGNAYLEESFSLLAARVAAVRNRMNHDADLMRRSLDEHRQIMEAVRAEEATRAGALLRAHVGRKAKLYAASLRPMRGSDPLVRVTTAEMERFARAAFHAAGCDDPTVDGLLRGLCYASRTGIEAHGYRMMPRILTAFASGRFNPSPVLDMGSGKGAVRVLRADGAHGTRAGFAAAGQAVELAHEYGVGAVAIREASSYGAAGAFVAAIAKAGMAGVFLCNMDEPYPGAQGGAFPLAFAAPAGDEPPWLIDTAGSALQFDKVLPGRDARKGEVPGSIVSEMLASLGGVPGFKGEGLVDILTSAFSDAPLGREISGEEVLHPGAVVLALDPDAFIGRAVFEKVVRRIHSGQPPQPEEGVRTETDITLDPTTIEALSEFAATYGIAPLFT